jgi:raffinose/stachyose/melibiose transport system substrate-binding protein
MQFSLYMEVERMSFPSIRRAAVIAGVGAAALSLVLSGCSSSSGGSGDNGSVTISYMVDNGAASTAAAEALIKDFESKNPNIHVDLETRPAGAEGDNLIKTKLATGDMNDLFLYNTGSLLKALNPDNVLANVSGESWTSKLDDSFKQVASTDKGLYGAPWGPSLAGAIIYNKDIYAELGLQIPKTWAEFMANNKKIADAGKAAPIAQTYGATWTSQLFVLGDFYNVQSKDPNFAEDYTANKAKFSDPAAITGFQHLEEAKKAGYFNKDYASATYDDGVKMIATGKAAHYPILTFAASALTVNYPDAVKKVGLFPIPGDSPEQNGLTVWMPSGVFIPKSTEGAKLDASKKFLDFLTTPDACKLMSEKISPTGPFVVEGCKLPADVPTIVSDMQPYFDKGKTKLALEFLSPIKGPALEQITVAVGSGITSAKDGAAQYDEDVKKQAKQLNIPGW